MINNTPLVSVIILTYKTFDFLKETINSVFIQDYTNIEIVISDDNSPNYSESFIKSLLSEKPEKIRQVQIIRHDKNIGTVKNFNNAIIKAKGEFIFGLSSDDSFFNRKVISTITECFLKTNALIITTKQKLFDQKDYYQNGDILPGPQDSKYLTTHEHLLYQRLCFGNFISGASTYYTKKLFEKYGYFDEEYFLLEDYPKYLQLAREGEKIYFLDYIAINYRGGGMSDNHHPSISIRNTLKIDFRKTFEHEILPFADRINPNLMAWKLYDYKSSKKEKIAAFKALRKCPSLYFILILKKLKILYVKPEFFI